MLHSRCPLCGQGGWHTGQVRAEVQEPRVDLEGARGLLPASIDELPFLRVWLSLVGLGRLGGPLGEAVQPWLRADNDTIRRLVGSTPETGAPATPALAARVRVGDELRVLADGLMLGLCRRVGALDQARRMISDFTSRHGLDERAPER